MLTLRELVRDLGLTLRTAEEGLATPVRWVHLSELTDPTPWLSGGELLLTTGLALTTPKEQRDFIARLAGRGIAALGFGAGVVHRGVPKALLGACEQHALPLLEIPYEVPFIAVTERAFARLVNEQYALLQRSVVVQQELQQIVLREGGLSEIAAVRYWSSTVAAGCSRPAARTTTRSRPPPAPSSTSASSPVRRAGSYPRSLPVRSRCRSRPAPAVCRRPGWRGSSGAARRPTSIAPSCIRA